jgi:hypothetical protein
VTRIDLPYVKFQRDRKGRRRFVYFRRGGRFWRLPGSPGDPEFLAEYQRLLAAAAPVRSAQGGGLLPGSFGAVVLDYLASPESKQPKPNTQRIYRLVLERLAEAHRCAPTR